MDSSGADWEHVSVHVETLRDNNEPILHTPTMEQLMRVKWVFWDDDEWAIHFVGGPPSRLPQAHLWRHKVNQVDIPHGIHAQPAIPNQIPRDSA